MNVIDKIESEKQKMKNVWIIRTERAIITTAMTNSLISLVSSQKKLKENKISQFCWITKVELNLTTSKQAYLQRLLCTETLKT